jgi:hypothetical protein
MEIKYMDIGKIIKNKEKVYFKMKKGNIYKKFV